MKIAIGNDHAAVDLKNSVMEYLEEKGIEIDDFGVQSTQRANYPVYAEKVAKKVLSGEYDCGILICGTGVGISIAANKFKGIRAAAVSDPTTARLVKQHNNANILCFGARIVGEELAHDIVDAYIEAQFEGGRHQDRIDLITAIEEKGSCIDG
ncbi:MAG: ribose 5-phosphate isomerase B [Eubacterium sp.]|nr:ribose 5-phosphate isomerase B [Eubacterium sp.]